MSKEDQIELLAWMIMIPLLFVLIPKSKYWEAQLNFLFAQTMTWPLGIIVVYFHLLEYPYRLFPNVLRTSFSYEFFFLPAISAIFYVHFPSSRSVLRKIIYVIFYPTLLTLLELIALKTTRFIIYIHWTGYYTWASTLLLLLASYLYTKRFFKKVKNYI